MNDTEKLSQQLYDKALNEMSAFLDDLKTKSPGGNHRKRL